VGEDAQFQALEKEKSDLGLDENCLLVSLKALLGGSQTEARRKNMEQKRHWGREVWLRGKRRGINGLYQLLKGLSIIKKGKNQYERPTGPCKKQRLEL